MNRVLLVIDVQNEYFTGKLPVSYPPGTLNNIIQIMDAAQKNKIPVIVIQHTASQQEAPTFIRGSESWKLHPLIESKPRDYLMEKTLPGSFSNTDLEQWLRKRDINTVVITGYMTQMCCDTTSRQAFHMGFNVEFLSDATGTLQISNYAGIVTGEELHKAILVTQAMKFSKVLTTQQWINQINEIS